MALSADIYSDSIEYFIQKWILSKSSWMNYSWEESISRAEISKIIIMTLWYTLSQDEIWLLSDVESWTWYTSYVNTATKLWIISGYLDWTFRPASPVNRVEFLKILAKSFGLKEYLKCSYNDVNRSDWFYRYCWIAEKFDIYNSKELLPNKAVTRSEVLRAVYVISNKKSPNRKLPILWVSTDFSVNKLLNWSLLLDLPTNFTVIPDEAINAQYPDLKWKSVYLSKDKTSRVTIEKTMQPFVDENIEIYKKQMQITLNQMFKDSIWLKSDVKEVNDNQVMIYEFLSKNGKETVFNYLFIVWVDWYATYINFWFPSKQKAKWIWIANVILNSIITR